MEAMEVIPGEAMVSLTPKALQMFGDIEAFEEEKRRELTHQEWALYVAAWCAGWDRAKKARRR